MKKTALILNASHNDYRLILALKELDYYVLTIGNTPGLMGEKYADEYIKMDYSDKESVLQLAKDREIDAVCSCCNDIGVLTSAYVAEQMGLPGHDSYQTACTIHHKDKFKEFAKKNDIKTPLAESFSCPTEAYQWIEKNEVFPIMVKAADLSAGNGITKVDGISQAIDAIDLAYRKSKTKQIVIEPYIEGSQHAICTFLIDEKVAGFGSNNEYSIINPYRVEIDTYPADHIDEVKDFLISQIEKIAKILHLNDGIFEVQYHYTANGEVWIMECMRRVLGNLYSIPSSNLCGFNWDYWEARSHCGLDCSDFPRDAKSKGYYAYRSLISKCNGIYKGYQLSDEVNQYLSEECILVEPGQIIENFRSEPMGFLFFSFPNKKIMDDIMIGRYEEIKVLVGE